MPFLFSLSVFSLKPDSNCPFCSAYLYLAWGETVPSVALSILPICIQPEPRQSHLLTCLICLSVFWLIPDGAICCPACSEYLYSDWAQTVHYCSVFSAYLYSDGAQTVPSVALSVLPICIQLEPRQSHLLPCLFCLFVFSLSPDSPICFHVCSAYLFSAKDRRQWHLLPCLFCLLVFCLRP